jgi:hypothetical protein
MACALPIDLFKKYVSTFCLISYYDERFEFTDEEILSAIRKGLRLEEATVDADKFLRDLIESVCLIQRDGLKYVFTHRSFQEFFAAVCLTRVPASRVTDLIVRIARRDTDNTISMLYDMNREFVESNYVIPSLRAVVERLKAHAAEPHLRRENAVFGTGVVLFFRRHELLDDTVGNRRLLRAPFRVNIAMGIFPGNDNEHLKRHIVRLYKDFMRAEDENFLPFGGDNEVFLKIENTIKKYSRSVPAVAIEQDPDGRFFAVVRKSPNLKSSKKSQPIRIEVADFSGSKYMAYITIIHQKLITLLPYLEKKTAHRREVIDELFGLSVPNARPESG